MKTVLHPRWRPFGWALLLTGALLGSRSAAAQVDTYSFAPSAGTYTPLPATATALTTINSDDAVSAALPLGFTFVYDGTPFTQVYANSNGFLSFNAATPGSGSYTNDLGAVTADFRPMVAPYWDDLTGSGGTSTYQTTGTAPNRTFTFEWLNWRQLSASGAQVSMQVQLVEGTNVVRFIYRPETTPVSGASASIGLAGTGTGSGSFLSLSDASATASVSGVTENQNISTVPVAGQTYTFTPPVPSACPTPRNLTATVSTTTAQLSWTVAAGTGPFTIQYGLPGFNPALPSSPTNFYTTITSATATAAIAGLTAQTSYQFYVTQNCGGTAGNSTRSNPGSFTTQITNDEPCTAIDLPVTNTCTPVSGTTFGATTTTPVGYTNPGNCASFNSTPLDVWFKFTTAATGPTSTQVRISVTGGTAEVVRGFSGTLCSGSLTSLNCSGTGSGSPAPNLDLINLTPNTVYFVQVSNFDSFQPVLGPFSICATPVPNCPTPAGLTASGLTNTTANLSWNATSGGTGSTYTVIYGPNGFDPTAGGTSVTGLTAGNTTIAGLSANTPYQFYVQQICGGFNGSSTLTGPISFTTPLTAPLNNDPCGAVALGTMVLSSTNVGATTSIQNGINTPTCAGGALPKDVWFTFTPTGTSATLTFTGNAAGAVRLFASPDCAAGLFNQVFCQGSGTANTSLGAVSVTGLTAGTRYYMAVSGYTGSDVSGAFTITGTGLVTGAKTQADTNALLVYPNPSNTGQLTLRLNGFSGKGQATLLNALGQVVLTKTLSGTTEQDLSTQGLATGIYTLRVAVAGQVLTRKVVLN